MEDSNKKKSSDIPVEEVSSASREELSKMSLDELNTLLNDVLEQEDYIRAIAIRDEINKRK
jgi:protein-arginine kinase activator protein McsA